MADAQTLPTGGVVKRYLVTVTSQAPVKVELFPFQTGQSPVQASVTLSLNLSPEDEDNGHTANDHITVELEEFTLPENEWDGIFEAGDLTFVAGRHFDESEQSFTDDGLPILEGEDSDTDEDFDDEDDDTVGDEVAED